MPRLKSSTLNLRIDPKLKKDAEKAALKDRRSLTSFVEKLLSDYIVCQEPPIGKDSQ
jgi:predicted HicB family RNase H-like nuclease